MLQKVLDQYIDHVLKLAGKKPSHKRNLGIAYYNAAAERVLALINAPTPEWIGMRLENAKRLR
jgi:hypothetical protein